MVNVTKSNFVEQSNDLLQHLPTAAFVAIDEEMTGIMLPGSNRPPQDDTPSQRYQAKKAVPERYSMVQLGVALFHEHPAYDATDPTTPEFLVRRYNFYAFPPSEDSLTREVTMNPSAAAFLAQHNMDFDLWTKQGVSYVTTDKMEELVETYKVNVRKQAEENSIKPCDPHRRKVQLSRQDDIHFVARTMASMREWLDSGRSQRRIVPGERHDQLEGSSLLLPPCNAFLRRALYESIEVEYPALVLEKAGRDQIRVLRMNEEERTNRYVRLRKEGWEGLVMQVGLSRVFRAISNACRGYTEVDSLVLAMNVDEVDLDAKPRLEPLPRHIPIVVHNGYMDLLFLMTHFYSHKLPPTYNGMKALVAHHFPVVYDTKEMASQFSEPSIAEGRSTLADLYPKLVTDQPEVGSSRFQLVEGSNDEGQEHEASFDAFMTGCVFVGLIWHISTFKGYETNLDDDAIKQGGVGSMVPLLEPLDSTTVKSVYGRNMLHLMQTMYTVDLEDPYSDPLKGNLSARTSFRVSGIDKAVNTRDIVACLTNLTAPNASRPIQTTIIWVDDTTFVVGDKDPRDDDMRRLHGVAIQHALRERFEKATIVTLEEHYKKMKLMEDSNLGQGWTARLSGTFSSMLGYGKRRTDDTEDEAVRVEHPRAKKRRLEQ